MSEILVTGARRAKEARPVDRRRLRLSGDRGGEASKNTARRAQIGEYKFIAEHTSNILVSKNVNARANFFFAMKIFWNAIV